MSIALDRTATAFIPDASGRYVRELDGIRAVAVGIVVAAHYRLLPYMPGGFGVTLFFFLSGYLITTLFFAEYRTADSISVRRFYARRWLRLTPSLIISVLLGVIFYRVTRNWVGGTPVPVGTTLAALFYFTNYYDLFWHLDATKVIPFGICWSLAIEEHFYLIWPWVIRNTIQRPQRLVSVVVGACLVTLVWRCIAHYGLALSTDYTYMATDCRIDAILFGALLRIMYETRWAANFVEVLRSRVIQGAALALLLLGFLVRDDGFRETIRYTIEGAALMPCFAMVLTGDPKGLLRRVLGSRPLVLIGKLSYSIYLFHLLARTPGEVYFGSPYSLGATITGLVGTAIIAWMLYTFIERPLASLRHRFRSSPDRSGAPLQAGNSADDIDAAGSVSGVASR